MLVIWVGTLGVPRGKKYNTQEIHSRKNTGLKSGRNAVHTRRNYYNNYHAVKHEIVCDCDKRLGKEK